MSAMKVIIELLMSLLMTLSSIYSYSQVLEETTTRNVLLNEIVGNINGYKARIVTLQLKLKHLDTVFEKITFYDKKNHDIEFDISDRFLKKRIAPDMLNLHEGMEYNVTFIIQNIGTLGQIIAELKGFKPVILDSVPENRN